MFRTEITAPPSEEKITVSSPILSIGSCFSDCMGQRFATHKFDVVANPFGTVYNPVSIFKLLEYAVNRNYPKDSSYVETQGLISNFDFHSSFSAEKTEKIKKDIQNAIEHTHEHLKKCEWMIITLGTAFVYRRKDNKDIVANCHKVPAGRFTKELLTQKQIIEAFEKTYELLLSLQPNIKIIMTVSPVRHTKDTLEQNSVSKSILRVTCDTLEKEQKNIRYFPSYEIMMDDLRDYRFYRTDMIHPTRDAEDYIWHKFSEAYFNQETHRFIEEWDKIMKAIQHRPFNPASEAHQKFIKETIKHLKRLEKKVDIHEELAQLQDQLISK
ncbi:hypothetical protein C900_05209 [Fulvivirga imtechensis AK7]|uniref:GSCFA domain-containing protein n=1 Tax=Fulvivirga imtechensis AK7 TaxID=1237149 RepID=L8JWJ9_9BACT|nr:GSCFA domain-containing protein [Fulvivirga imtechensis]ELR73160.1 hypothetical protein C900_05209 [Fulvivirga imtechensis AK7]